MSPKSRLEVGAMAGQTWMPMETGIRRRTQEWCGSPQMLERISILTPLEHGAGIRALAIHGYQAIAGGGHRFIAARGTISMASAGDGGQGHAMGGERACITVVRRLDLGLR